MYYGRTTDVLRRYYGECLGEVVLATGGCRVKRQGWMGFPPQPDAQVWRRGSVLLLGAVVLERRLCSRRITQDTRTH